MKLISWDKIDGYFMRGSFASGGESTLNPVATCLRHFNDCLFKVLTSRETLRSLKNSRTLSNRY